MAVRDAPLIAALREISGRYPRWGYRKAQVLLARQGLVLSENRVHRLWRKAKLQVPRRRRKRRGTRRDPMTVKATQPNQVWAYDFVHDTTVDDRKLKVLTVVDEYTRECLAIDVARSIRSSRVVDVLRGLVEQRGAPSYVRSDNGPEFVAFAVQDWLEQRGVKNAFIQPGRPWQNGKNESFNGRLRDECLDQEWFFGVSEASVVIEDFRRTFNEVRPHRSLNGRTPVEVLAAFNNKQQEAGLAL